MTGRGCRHVSQRPRSSLMGNRKSKTPQQSDGESDLQCSRAAGALTLAAGLRFASVSAKRGSLAHSTARFACGHAHLVDKTARRRMHRGHQRCMQACIPGTLPAGMKGLQSFLFCTAEQKWANICGPGISAMPGMFRMGKADAESFREQIQN